MLALTVAGAAQAQTARDVITGYADLALVKHTGSLFAAWVLDAAIDAFVAAPTADTHRAAKNGWLSAHVHYQQTEAYRFGNAAVDAWRARSTPGSSMKD